MNKTAAAYETEQQIRYQAELAEDEERWRRYKETGEFVSHEEMVAYLKTWGTDADPEKTA